MLYYTFIGSVTNKEKGMSKVNIRYKNKIFSGEAHMHPDDEWSEFFGCKIAEIRAKTEAAKWILKEKREEYSICKKFVKSIECYKNFDPNSTSAKAVYRQLNQKKKEVENAKQLVAGLKRTIPLIIKEREEFRKRIAKLKEQKASGQTNEIYY